MGDLDFNVYNYLYTTLQNRHPVNTCDKTTSTQGRIQGVVFVVYTTVNILRKN